MSHREITEDTYRYDSVADAEARTALRKALGRLADTALLDFLLRSDREGIRFFTTAVQGPTPHPEEWSQTGFRHRMYLVLTDGSLAPVLHAAGLIDCEEHRDGSGRLTATTYRFGGPARAASPDRAQRPYALAAE